MTDGAAAAPARAWTRLLDDPVAEAAVETARGLAAALLAVPPPDDLGSAPPLLSSGALGAVLFLAALGEATAEPSYTSAASELLDRAVERAAEQPPEIPLYGSPVGLGWTYAVLEPRLSDEPSSDEDTVVDEFVARALAVTPWPAPVDLLYGLAGLGVYALARLPRPGAARSLERVVGHLAAAAVPDGPGVTWVFVPPSPTYEFTERRPPGHVDVGFAHGVPGIVAFLAEAVRAGVSGARELLEPGVRWLLAQRLGPDAYGSFPGVVVRGRPPEDTRLAWCYGDPGVAVALLAAGHALGDADLVEQARAVALRCGERTAHGVSDATFCHGSAGLGHVFNRLGQALGDERLLDQARRWFAVTLRVDGLALADPTAAKEIAAAGGSLAVEPGPGLLTGLPGVGLALLAAATEVEPWWDPALLAGPWRPVAP